MAYSTQDDIQTAVGGLTKLAQLSDQEGNLGGGVNVTVITKAIAQADAVIDSYTGHRFGVPMSPVPPSINAMSAQWAARLLRRWLYQGQPGNVTDQDHDQEVIDREWLDGVSKGTISLGLVPIPPPAVTVTDKVGERDSTLIVSRRRLRGYA